MATPSCGRVILAAGFTALLFSSLASAATFTVDNTNDSGAGSLRQAMLDANTTMGDDTIDFAIPGAGVHTITVSTNLPTITDPVVIDGTTQPGYAGAPLVELTCSPVVSFGIRITGGASTVRGLAITGFSTGISLLTGGGNVVEGCYLGPDAAGTGGASSGTGVSIQSSDGNTIGGTAAADRNIISANNSNGIQVITSDATIIQGNYIGTDVTGMAALGNNTGITVVNSTNALIGGAGAGARNVISGNTGDGVLYSGGSGHVLQGNLIGTDATGTQPLGNNFAFDSNNFANGFVIGGPGPGEGNLVSGNNQGLFLNGTVHDAIIQGNFIGTDVTGMMPIPNNIGILLNTLAATDILIGGTAPGEGNLIAFNEGVSSVHGIWNLGLRVTIRGNSIHDNQGLGIDNGGNGVTANDPGDGDTGPNDLQNFPIVSSAMPLAPVGNGVASTRIQGILHSAASTTYDLDFYANDPCSPRPQDFLEGTIFLGSSQVATDGNGDGPFDVTLPVSIAAGSPVSATATDPSGNTSEFSQRMPFSVLPASGPSAGATNVTVSGTDFAAGATVTIGGQPATNVDVTNSTTLTATTPPLTAGTVNDLTVTNTDASSGTLPRGFVSDFLDVPNGQQFYSFVTTLVRNAITAGIGGGLYGVNDSTLRQQMAVFLLKAKYGVCYSPPPCTGAFTDVPCPSTFANWIEALSAEGITGGCGGTNYCPQNPVRRDQMAVFLLKAEHGSSYTPPACSGVFPDVPCPSTFANWIEQLAAEAITGGCGGGNYCPLNPNTRGQMAVFISKTFNLQ
jgi:hypothetical protein